MNPDLRWIRIAGSVAEIPFGNNGIAEISAEGKMICVSRFKESLFAFAHKCPHASGPLAEGYVDALGNVVCPLHRYRFCPANGRNISGEGYYLKHWPLEVRENGVFVGFPPQKLFGLF